MNAIRTPHFRDVVTEGELVVREMVVNVPSRITVISNTKETLVEVSPMAAATKDGAADYYHGRINRGLEALNGKHSAKDIAKEVDKLKEQADALLYNKRR